MVLFKFQNVGFRGLAASPLPPLGSTILGRNQSTLLENRRPHGRQPKCSERQPASTAKSVIEDILDPLVPLNYEMTTETLMFPAQTKDRIIQIANPYNYEKQ